MFWKRKKAKEEYSFEEIQEITRKTEVKREIAIKRAQENYLNEIERSIFKAAKAGETRFVTHRADSSFEDYITPEFLRKIADIYAVKGYQTTIVQPDPNDPGWMWVRIDWDRRVK